MDAAIPILLAIAAIMAAAAPAERVVALRTAVLAVLLLGLIATHTRESDSVWLWAGLLPMAVRLTYDAVVAAPSPSLADCGNVLALAAVARATEALVVVGAVAILGLAIPADRR